MKKILLICSLLFVLTFSYCSIIFAFSIDIPNQNAQNISREINVENVSTETSEPIITEVTESKKDELLTPTNIINIILIVVGIVLILLGIAILIRCK